MRSVGEADAAVLTFGKGSHEGVTNCDSGGAGRDEIGSDNLQDGGQRGGPGRAAGATRMMRRTHASAGDRGAQEK